MKQNLLLTVVSLFSLLLLTLHLADDIVRGMEPGGLSNLVGGMLISVVWLYGALVLAGRRSGYVTIILGSLLGMFVPYIHMRGKGVGVASGIANSSGGFFFGLDAHRARRDRALLRHPFGTRTVGPVAEAELKRELKLARLQSHPWTRVSPEVSSKVEPRLTTASS